MGLIDLWASVSYTILQESSWWRVPLQAAVFMKIMVQGARFLLILCSESPPPQVSKSSLPYFSHVCLLKKTLQIYPKWTILDRVESSFVFIHWFFGIIHWFLHQILLAQCWRLFHLSPFLFPPGKWQFGKSLYWEEGKKNPPDCLPFPRY